MIFLEYDPINGGMTEVPLWATILFVVICVGIYAGFYLLRSFGIYKLAKNNNVSKPYMAFIPGVWLYPACKLLSDARFFRTTIGRVGLIFTIIYSISTFGRILNYLTLYTPLVFYYLEGANKGAIILLSSQESVVGYDAYLLGNGFFNLNIFVAEGTFRSIYSMGFLNVFDYIRSVVFWCDLVSEVILVFVYFAIFRKFTPADHVLFAILSVFGLFAPLVFFIRNKKAVDYNAFIRSRMGYGNYGNSNYQGGQNNGGYNGNQTPPQTPFSDFDEDKNDKNNRPPDPFDDFN